MTTSTSASTVPATYIDRVPVAAITTHPDNPRHDVGDVDALAASIKDQGVLEPLVVISTDLVPHDVTVADDVAYCLIAGHRRLAAAELANVEDVPVIVRHDLTTRDAQVAAMVIENQHRADLSPIEEGEAYQLLLDITPDATHAAVAKAVGMPKRRVSDRVRLTRLDDAAKTAVHDGQITLTDALEILTIEDRYPDLAEKVTAAAGTKDFRYEMQRAHADATILDRYATHRALAEKLGTPVLDKTPGYGSDDPHPVRATTPGVDVPDEARTGDADEVIAVAEAHATCPGAAVHIPAVPNRAYDLAWVCTDYASHHYPTADDRVAEAEQREQERAEAEEARIAALTPQERAEEERAAAERAALMEAHADRTTALEAAQKTRRGFFFEVIQKGDPDLAKGLMMHFAAPSTFADGFVAEPDVTDEPLLAADLLGLDEDTTREDLTSALRRLTLSQLVILMWCCATRWLDDSLKVKAWTRPDMPVGPDPDYVRALTDVVGYPWSTTETTLLGLDEHGHVPTDDDGEDAA